MPDQPQRPARQSIEKQAAGELSDRPKDFTEGRGGVPWVIIFFPNGLCAVFDGLGRPLNQYQRGWHGTTIDLLKSDGYDWAKLPEITGYPLASPPGWFTDRDKWIKEEEAKARARQQP